MNYLTRFQIHFHDEYQASVQIKSDAVGNDKNFSEILLFCCLGLRQIHNLRSNRASIALAEILSVLDYSPSYWVYSQLMSKLKTVEDIAYYVPFIAALGIDISMLVGLIPSLAIYRVVNKLDNEQIACQICPKVAQVKEYYGVDGQKQFIASMELRDKNTFSFELQPKGFGIFGKGVNYYAPMSVILTFKYLYTLHYDLEPENILFWGMLRKAANLLGDAFLQGKVTTLSLVSLPLEIVNQVSSPR